MKFLIILTIAFVAIALAVQATPMKIRGFHTGDNGLFRKWVSVHIDSSDTVQVLGEEICEKLQGNRPSKLVLVTRAHSSEDPLIPHLSVESLLEDGDKVVVDCPKA